MKFDSMFGTGSSKLLHNVSFERSSFHHIIIRIFGIKHRETLVVTSRETDISGSRSLARLHPLIRIKLGWIKSTCQFGILFIIQIYICHSPFTGSKHCIQSPMKENTKLIILKLFPCFQVFFCRLIGRLGKSPTTHGE